MKQSLRKRQTVFVKKPNLDLTDESAANIPPIPTKAKRYSSLISGNRKAQYSDISGFRAGPAVNSIAEGPPKPAEATTEAMSIRPASKPHGAPEIGMRSPAREEIPPLFTREGSLEPLPREMKALTSSGDHDPALTAPNFDPDMFLLSKLSRMTLDDMDSYFAKLQAQSEALAQEEISNIRRNFNTFLAVSHDINDLSSQVTKLRKLVLELRAVTDALKQDAILQVEAGKSLTGTLSGARGSANGEGTPQPANLNRNSVLMLNNIWAVDMMSLMRQVEGLQKYLPTIPGRHVVLNSPGWSELNTVTWQPIKPITLFLVNDHLIITTNRKSRAYNQKSTKRSLSVEQCIPLDEIQLEDLSHKATTLSLKVTWRATQREFTFSPPSAGSLRKFVDEFYRTVDALRPKSKGTAAGERQSVSKHQNHRRQGSTLSTHSLTARSIEDRREGLRVLARIDLLIASKQLNSAADMCRSNEDSELIGVQISERKDELINKLFTRIESSNSSQSEVLGAISLLKSFDKTQEAKTRFLKSRTDVLNRTVRSLAFEDDVTGYVQKVAATYFQRIAATVGVYTSGFKDRSQYSTVVSWARDRVAEYAEFLRRQLHGIEHDTSTYEQCLNLSHKESSQLYKLGLDMDYLLSDLEPKVILSE